MGGSLAEPLAHRRSDLCLIFLDTRGATTWLLLLLLLFFSGGRCGLLEEQKAALTLNGTDPLLHALALGLLHLGLFPKPGQAPLAGLGEVHFAETFAKFANPGFVTVRLGKLTGARCGREPRESPFRWRETPLRRTQCDAL